MAKDRVEKKEGGSRGKRIALALVLMVLGLVAVAPWIFLADRLRSGEGADIDATLDRLERLASRDAEAPSLPEPPTGVELPEPSDAAPELPAMPGTLPVPDPSDHGEKTEDGGWPRVSLRVLASFAAGLPMPFAVMMLARRFGRRAALVLGLLTTLAGLAGAANFFLTGEPEALDSAPADERARELATMADPLAAPPPVPVPVPVPAAEAPRFEDLIGHLGGSTDPCRDHVGFVALLCRLREEGVPAQPRESNGEGGSEQLLRQLARASQAREEGERKPEGERAPALESETPGLPEAGRDEPGPGTNPALTGAPLPKPSARSAARMLHGPAFVAGLGVGGLGVTAFLLLGARAAPTRRRTRHRTRRDAAP